MSLFTFFILWVVDFNDLYDKRYKDNKIGAKTFRIHMYIVNIYEYLTPYLAWSISHGSGGTQQAWSTNQHLVKKSLNPVDFLSLQAFVAPCKSNVSKRLTHLNGRNPFRLYRRPWRIVTKVCLYWIRLYRGLIILSTNVQCLKTVCLLIFYMIYLLLLSPVVSPRLICHVNFTQGTILVK